MLTSEENVKEEEDALFPKEKMMAIIQEHHVLNIFQN